MDCRGPRGGGWCGADQRLKSSDLKRIKICCINGIMHDYYGKLRCQISDKSDSSKRTIVYCHYFSSRKGGSRLLLREQDDNENSFLIMPEDNLVSCDYVTSDDEELSS